MVTSVAMVSVRTDNPPIVPLERGRQAVHYRRSGLTTCSPTPTGVTVGTAHPVQAMDAETAQLLTYSLSGPGMGSFSITSDTDTDTDANGSGRGGQISVNSGVKLDHEAESSYTVTVTATDPDNLSESIDVTISVTDVDEAPVFGEVQVPDTQPTNNAPAFAAAADTREVAENTAAGEDIGTPVAATDADVGDTLTYTLGGDDAASFDIDPATGQIMTKAALDFETEASYSVTVTASDGTDEDTITVTITVTDVDDEPVGDPLLAEYDPNGDGRIEKADMRLAVGNFFGPTPTLSRADMRILVGIYFAP